MRQTGRTSRIIDFAIDQLFSCGEVIFTDHTAFEYPRSNIRPTLELMCHKIRERITIRSSEYELDFNIIQIGDGSGMKMVHARLNRNETDFAKDSSWITVK